MSHQLHEPLGRLSFDLEHHSPLERPQPIMREKKRNENGWDANWHKPFVTDMARRMKHESTRR